MNLRPPGYEPGELPDCSTPRRERQYTTVDAIFWAALGFFVVAAVAGSAYVGLRAWHAWQACVSLSVAGAAGYLASYGAARVNVEAAAKRLGESL